MTYCALKISKVKIRHALQNLKVSWMNNQLDKRHFFLTWRKVQVYCTITKLAVKQRHMNLPDLNFWSFLSLCMLTQPCSATAWNRNRPDSRTSYKTRSSHQPTLSESTGSATSSSRRLTAWAAAWRRPSSSCGPRRSPWPRPRRRWGNRMV